MLIVFKTIARRWRHRKVFRCLRRGYEFISYDANDDAYIVRSMLTDAYYKVGCNANGAITTVICIDYM